MSPPPADQSDHAVTVHLDELLQAQAMTLTELAERVGITIVNLSILKNGRAKAIRFNTLTAICEALNCQPGDLLHVTTTTDHNNLEPPQNRPPARNRR
jgi:putative transcriptional regulator